MVAQDLQLNGFYRIRSKPKLFQKTQKRVQKFLEETWKPKVIHTDNSPEFGKACEDLSWNHCISTPHRSETNGVAEREVRRIKEGTSPVLLQSSLDEKWWADSMECCCYLRNFQDLLSDGKTPCERRSERLLTDRRIPPYLCEGHRKITSIRSKNLTRYTPWIRVARGRNLVRRHLRCRHWGMGTDGRIWNLCKKKTQCNEVLTPMNGEKFTVPFADGTVKLSGGGSGSENIHFNPGTAHIEEKNKEIFQENETSGPFQGTTFTVITLNGESKLYMPREESSLIPLKFFDVTRTTDTSFDVMLEKNINDSRHVDVGREMSDMWTGFTRFTALNQKPPDRFSRSRERLTRKQTTSMPDNFGQGCGKICPTRRKRKEKPKWPIVKWKLDNARRLRGIYFIDHNDEEFKKHHEECA